MLLDERERIAFLSVASHGSIGRASAALGMSQPTLSRIVKRLEQHLGVPLFDRFASGVALTVYGEALLPFASRIELEANHAQDEIGRLKRGTAGVLRIGAAPSLGSAFLPAILNRMVKETPDLRVEMIEGTAEILEPALIGRRIDVVMAGELSDAEDIQKLDICFEDHGAVIAAADHPVRAKERLVMADLLDQPWVLPPGGTEPRLAFESYLTGIGIKPPHIAVETWSVPMMKALVTDSGFISWLPSSLYSVEERAGFILPLDIPGMTVRRRSYVYRRRMGLVPPAVVRFLEVARAMRR
ncbi:MAG: LysR family transcriptional regulator [Sphingomonadales bacterium]|nr:LysR family transcriptional regulator [Sphingomonadales bacterium]